jgi:hypothetical protein
MRLFRRIIRRVRTVHRLPAADPNSIALVEKLLRMAGVPLKPAPAFLFVAIACLVPGPARSAENAAADSTPPPSGARVDPEMLGILKRHADLLLGTDGSARRLKGKTAAGQEAFAFYVLFELTRQQPYRQAALRLADGVLRDMRATKFGVLPIKEKEKAGGETITGGGPPALGFYVARVAYILHREGGRDLDLHYLADVVDRYPWSEQGWWASTIDVKTGEPKEPLTKPSIINKSASIAMAAGILSRYLSASAPEVSQRLRQKVDACLAQLLAAQEPDGFWHYSFSGNDPKEKDVFGYFMLTTNVLMDLQQFNDAYRQEKLTAAIRRAQGFARRCIAPMTEPNPGPAPRDHATAGTPVHYALAEDVKRGFALARMLRGSEEGATIMRAALARFPFGNAGQDGAHAAEPVALLLLDRP